MNSILKTTLLTVSLLAGGVAVAQTTTTGPGPGIADSKPAARNDSDSMKTSSGPTAAPATHHVKHKHMKAAKTGSTNSKPGMEAGEKPTDEKTGPSNTTKTN